jgi:hypothetical protein
MQRANPRTAAKAASPGREDTGADMPRLLQVGQQCSQQQHDQVLAQVQEDSWPKTIPHQHEPWLSPTDKQKPWKKRISNTTCILHRMEGQHSNVER